MTKHVFDKIALKNSENLSSHNFTNNYTLGISDNINDLKIDDDVSNEDILYDSNIEEVEAYKEEENKIAPDNKGENIKVTDLPIFPNLSE